MFCLKKEREKNEEILEITDTFLYNVYIYSDIGILFNETGDVINIYRINRFFFNSLLI